MMLFIAYRINANKNILPLAQALVPIKDIFQWTQFLSVTGRRRVAYATYIQPLTCPINKRVIIAGCFFAFSLQDKELIAYFLEGVSISLLFKLRLLILYRVTQPLYLVAALSTRDSLPLPGPIDRRFIVLIDLIHKGSSLSLLLQQV